MPNFQANDPLVVKAVKANWISEWDGLTPLDAAQRANAPELIEWLRDRGAKSAEELKA